MKESYPLAWPEGWVRTRPQDRKGRAAWNKPQNFYRLSLEREMQRMKAVSFVISSHVPLNLRGAMTAGVEPLDPGVSVWFSRPGKEDFAWQDALGIHDPAPVGASSRRKLRRQSPVQPAQPLGNSGSKSSEGSSRRSFRRFSSTAR